MISIQVVLTREDNRYRAEATLHARGDHFLHGEATGRAVKTAATAALGKIDHQAQKLKDKWSKRPRAGASLARSAGRVSAGRARRSTPTTRAKDTAPPQPRIVRTRRSVVKPMTIDGAALEVGGDHSAFVVFRNASTDAINVLFRRPDGHLGLIEPED